MNRTARARAPWLLALIVALLVPAGDAGAQGTEAVVYLVRHAEKVDDGSDDPPLSTEGRARADQLARMLGAAGITAVYTTPYARTRATAEPVARAAGVPVEEYSAEDPQAVVERLRQRGGTLLVVGHSNTLPGLVRLLGGNPGGPISEEEYGRLYQLTLDDDGARTAIFGFPGGFLADPPPSAGVSPAAASDVESIDAIVAALYDVISGPAGEARDWDRLRSLFLPTARMLPVQRAPDGRVSVRPITVEEYVRVSGPRLVEVGFREREVAREVDEFGDVAQVFSTYEGSREGQAEPLVRGINTIQLVYDGSRWWVSSLAWSAERPDLPLPARYGGRR